MTHPAAALDAPVLPLHLQAPSWQSRVIELLLRLLSVKKKTATAEAIRRTVEKLQARPPSHAPTGLGPVAGVGLEYYAGWPVYHVLPTSRQAPVDVVFIHGGGYIHEIARAHWRFIGDLTRATGARCVVPIYALAPNATAGEVVPQMAGLLEEHFQTTSASRVVVIGNSAGAGLALAAVQHLRDAGVRPPDSLVLVSPGVDAGLDARALDAAAADPMQAIPGILEAARLYAGDLDIRHPFVSPLHGGMHGLPPMLVFSGTHDLLHPQCIELCAKARAAGVPVEFHLRAGQPHNYPVMPTPEGSEARHRIFSAVRDGNAGEHR